MLLAYTWPERALEHTWPPGPELRENESSTELLVIDWFLKRAIHERASSISSRLVRETSRGAICKSLLDE